MLELMQCLMDIGVYGTNIDYYCVDEIAQIEVLIEKAVCNSRLQYRSLLGYRVPYLKLNATEDWAYLMVATRLRELISDCEFIWLKTSDGTGHLRSVREFDLTDVSVRLKGSHNKAKPVLACSFSGHAVLPIQ